MINNDHLSKETKLADERTLFANSSITLMIIVTGKLLLKLLADNSLFLNMG